MLFRNATSRDIPALVKLRVQALSEINKNDNPVCEKMYDRYFFRLLTSNYHICYIGVCENEVIAMGIMRFSYYPPDFNTITGICGHIECIYALPKCRIKGVDKDIFEKLMARAYVRSADIVTCNINELDVSLYEGYEFLPKTNVVYYKLRRC
jgi:hypothetical protein